MIHLLIPARKNSKSIKNKNIVKIKNKELIYYSIKIAKQLKSVSKIIVSTDSEKIKKISEKYGAEVPFLRPSKFAKDNSNDLQVFKHYIEFLKKNKIKIPELIIHLRPTTPFRSKNIINKAINIVKKNKKISSLRSMRESNFSPYKMWYIKKTGKSYPVISSKKELHSSARQKLLMTYDHIGYIDILRVKKTIIKNSITGNFVYPFILKKKHLKKFVDIDRLNDLNKEIELA